MRGLHLSMESDFTMAADSVAGFLKYVKSKRRWNVNIGQIFVGSGHLTNRDEGKIKAFNDFSVSVFSNGSRPWAVWS